MVMADIGDRGRRRRRRGGRREFQDRDSMMPPVMLTKTPTILAKPTNHGIDTMKNLLTGSLLNGGEPDHVMEKPVSLMTRADRVLSKEGEHPVPDMVNGGTVLEGGVSVEGPGSPQVYSIQRPAPAQRLVTAGDKARIQQVVQGPTKLAPPPAMSRSVKLVDDALMWSESGMDVLLDQTDFIVVGVIGMQGVGKSFILSQLSSEEVDSKISFRVQQRDMRDVCGHQTVGIDMYVTSERTIYLDTQPMLSPSVLHYMIQHDKKYPAEFISTENCIEIQSLQIASFMLTVCNVVLVVTDWFVDTNLIRFLRTAEMLKPPTPALDNTVVEEYFPHLVVVLNKADRDDFSVETYTTMQDMLKHMMDKSKLKYTGGINMAGCRGLSGLTKNIVHNNFNLCLIPEMEPSNKENGVLSLMPNYRGHPGFDMLVNSLRKQLLSAPRHLLTHTTLSEKNWFHYAARTWESIKKSQMFLEYNRLLP